MVIVWYLEFKLLAHVTPSSELEVRNAGRTVIYFIVLYPFSNSTDECCKLGTLKRAGKNTHQTETLCLQ